MIEQKIKQSIVLDRVIPEYVLSEYPKFVQFIRSYYQWLETSDNTVDELNKLLANKDIDTVTGSNYSFFILDTFLSSIPKNLNLNYSNLLHNIRAFYSEKGTDDSIKAFFRLVSESTRPNTVIVNYTGFEDLLVGTVIHGTNSGSKATVNTATRLSADSNYVVLTLTYSTEPLYKTRFFTSADQVALQDGTQIPLAVEDFKVNIFYPKDYILRSSDGNYKQETRCRILLEEGRYRDFSNNPFTTSSGSSGRIEKQSYSIYNKNGYDYYDITLSFTIRRKWTDGEKLFVNGEELKLARVFAGITISDSGLGYKEGETFSIVSGSKEVGLVTVSSVNKSRIESIGIINGGNGYSVGDRFSFKYSDGIYGGGYVSRVSSGTITDMKVEHSRKNSNEYPEVIFASGNTSAILTVLGSNVGAINGAYISNVGADVDLNSTVVIPSKSFPMKQAKISLVYGTLYTTRKSFVDQRGTVSSHFRIQDNFYWQDFSYVVQYTHAIDFSMYLDLYKKVVHPAGTKVFFEMRRASDISSMNLRNTISGERKIIKEDISHQIISDVQFSTIDSYNRLKDLNPFQAYVYPYYVRESLKTFIMDGYLTISDFSATIDSFSDIETIHKYTNTIDAKGIYVKYFDSVINTQDTTLVIGADKYPYDPITISDITVTGV